jgi:hypothetical protein
MNETFIVNSSNGHLIVNKETGEVISCHEDRDCEGRLSPIVRFDVKEWKQYWKKEEVDEDIDILDLGSWSNIGGQEIYDEPAFSWREELKDVREGQDL